MEGLGSRLKAARVAASLTQQALAEKAGTSVGIVSTIETGREYVPGLDLAKRLADACGVSLDSLTVGAVNDTIRDTVAARAERLKASAAGMTPKATPRAATSGVARNARRMTPARASR